MPQQFEFLILNAPERLRQQGASYGLFGLRLDANRPAAASAAECMIVAAAGRKRTKELLKLARAQSRRVLLEVAAAEDAAMAAELGFDGVVSATPLSAPVPFGERVKSGCILQPRGMRVVRRAWFWTRQTLPGRRWRGVSGPCRPSCAACASPFGNMSHRRRNMHGWNR